MTQYTSGLLLDVTLFHLDFLYDLFLTLLSGGVVVFGHHEAGHPTIDLLLYFLVSLFLLLHLDFVFDRLLLVLLFLLLLQSLLFLRLLLLYVPLLPE